jgi:very-short-patch-repair endonuclease
MRSIPGGGRPDTYTLQSRARRLRTNATQAERYLWFFLRALRPHGHHFRRQAPMRHYILDFVCHSAKLVIELDGSQHADPDTEGYDARRTAFLQSQGYRVLRFWNGDVVNDRDGAMVAVWSALETPTRNAAHSAPPTRGR